MAGQIRITKRTAAQVQRWYDEHSVPAAFRHLDPMVLEYAFRQGGGDWRRCFLDESGKLQVHNKRKW